MKKFLKSFLSILLMSCMLFSVVLSGCGKKSDGEGDPESVEVNTYDYTTGIDFSGTPMKLVENGVAQYTIVVSKSASSLVSESVTELNNYVALASGGKLNVSYDESYSGDKYISVGNTVQFQSKGIDVSTIKYDGFIIKSIDNNIYIAANEDKGVQFGVYSFLERFLGVRWLTATATHIPQSLDVTAYPCDIKEEPIFRNRVWYTNDASPNKPIYSHLRYNEGGNSWYYPSNSQVHNITDYNEEDKKSIGYVNKYDVVDKATGKFIRRHSESIPLSESETTLGAIHPEYFTDMEGVDRDGNVKPVSSTEKYEICYTNGISEDGALLDGDSPARYVIDKLKLALEGDTDRIYQNIFIGHMDCQSKCTCKTCLARREKYLHSGLEIMFFNCVEREVNAWLKETQNRTVKFSIFAYSTTFEAPVKEENGATVPLSPLCIVSDNILVRIAPIDADYTYSFLDENQLPKWKKSFDDWKVVAKGGIRVWDYVIDFYQRQWWYPNLHYMKENLTFYRDVGVIDVFQEGSNHGSEPSFWTNALKSYVASRLYWNLDWNVNDLVNEFMELYFGPVAEAAKNYLNILDGHYATLRLEGSLDMKVVSVKCGYYDYKKYPLNWLTGLMSVVDNAILEVETSSQLTAEAKSQYISRLKQLRITPMAMIYKNYEYYYDVRTKKDFVREMVALYDELGYVTIGSLESIMDIKTAYGL